MDHFETIIYSVVLGLLIFMAAFFSAAETSLMAVNRYRLKHKARQKKRSAIIILKMLKRPDRLLGMILIGSNLATIVTSALATMVAMRLFGERGVLVSTFLVAIIILVFAEVAPKTLAAIYPDRVSSWVAWPVSILLKLFYPVVWLINAISNGVLRIFGIKVKGGIIEPLSREELRSVVYEATGKTSSQYQSMLLSILDLNQVTIEHVMVPRHEIIGIDLEEDWSIIQGQLSGSPHDWLPVYRENINNTVGILHLRELMRLSLFEKKIDKETLLKLLHEPYFVPEGTALNVQLANFQRAKKRMAMVVDEYGEILGLVTMEDILEEIVGDFTLSVAVTSKMIEKQADGGYLVEGGVTLRDLNRLTHWQLPTEGPRTLSGLIIEYLEAIPRASTCLKIAGHPIEILEVEENRIKMAKIFPLPSE